ncbi:MAG: tetratricopeptide repeat protein [Agromyces sp.]
MSMNGPSLRGAVDLSALSARPATPVSSQQAANASSLVVEATDANFSAVLELSRTVPVVVDLWATWCGPCTQLSPILEKLTEEYAGRVVLAKVDVDANPGLASAFQAQSIPTVVALIGGQAVPLFTGALPEAQVREVFTQLLSVAEQNGVTGAVPVDGAAAPVEAPAPPLNAHHQAAFDAIEAADYAAAAAAYRAALAENPKDADAVAGLAQVNLLARLQGKTLDSIRNAAAQNPSDLAAQLDVADLDLSGGHVEDAFARLLDAFPAADADGRKLIRERLLELFEVVGVTDPRVNTARSKLAGLLY